MKWSTNKRTVITSAKTEKGKFMIVDSDSGEGYLAVYFPCPTLRIVAALSDLDKCKRACEEYIPHE